MRIDAHVDGDFAQLQGDAEQYVTQCRERGVERIVLLDFPEKTREAYRALPDFVIPAPYLDIDVVTAHDIHACFDWGARGIKFYLPQFSYGDTRYDPLYRAIAERDGVAIFHTGYIMTSFSPDVYPLLSAQNHRPCDITLMRPAAVDCLARRHRTLKILMAHFGNPWWEEAWKIAYSNPNVYADLSGGTAIRRSTLMWREMFAPDGNQDSQALSKLLFATDVLYFADPGNEGFEAYMAFYDRIFDAVNASAEQRERIDRGNAVELFGIG